jgi:hypothetical protein
VLILDVADPYRRLELRGRARVEPDEDDGFADRVGATYGAGPRAHDAAGDGCVVVAIEPERVCPVDMSG